jgi:DNA (cytosine-5)-methyltransferase 1
MQEDYWPYFQWPTGDSKAAPTVGEVLFELMASRGWKGATQWRGRANKIAPTLVGGSHKHGGPDLGPTRAKRAWADLGVDALKLGDEVPGPDYEGMPNLTVEMAALLQGFPSRWRFEGRKTAAYRQVGNAFPPPVAKAVGLAIAAAVARRSSRLPAECAV